MDKNQWLGDYLSHLRVNVTDAYYTKCPQDWQEPDHIPTFNRIYWICGGEGLIRVADKTFYPLSGDLVIMPAAVNQSYSFIEGQQPYEKYWCHFDAIIGDMHMFRVLSLPMIIHPNNPDRFTALFSELCLQHQRGDFISAMRAKSTLLEIMASMMEHIDVNSIGLSTFTNALNVGKLLEYIERNLHKRISMDELAALLHFNANYFNKFFREHIGEPPGQYIERKRMEKAKLMLMTADCSLSDIAESIGMDRFYFSRMFKRYSGFTPSDFRTNHKPSGLKDKQK